jgi:hypothetical protein
MEDQPGKFSKDDQTIDWIGSLMKSYAASWHIQWIKGTLSRVHPKSMTGYVNALKLRFDDRDARDEAYANMEKVRYQGCIRDMFTKIRTFNDKAMISGAALKKMILERLLQKIMEHMHTVDLMGNTDSDIITIISNEGKTAEKWKATRKNLGLKSSLETYEQQHDKLEQSHYKPANSEQQMFTKTQKERITFINGQPERKFKRDDAKTARIDAMEIEQRKPAGECLRCAWPSDRKGSHRVKDCIRTIELDKGTASYPNAKEYQKMKVAGMELSS